MTDLPHGWDLKSLSSLVTLLSGFAYKSSDWKEIGVPVLKITNVRNGLVRLEGCSYISKERATESKQFAVHNNDLLITMTGEIGATGFYREEFEARLNQRVGKLVVKEGEPLDLKYLAYFFESPETRQEMWKLAKGIAQANISPKEILNLEIPLPPLPEQHKIVEILEDHLSRLDAALADVKQAKVKAAQFRRSLLQAAFTGNLESDGTRLMTELPTGWETRALKDWEMDAQSGFASGAHNSENKGVIHLRPMNISRLGKLDFENYKSVEDNSARRIVKGDILFNNTNSAELVGKTTIIDIDGEFAYSNHMTRLRFPVEKVDHKYMSILLHSMWMSGFFNEICSNHVNQASVSIKRLGQVEITLPPLPEQHKIVEILEDHLSRLDASIALADAMEKQSAGLRRSLLQAAFTGQLTKEVASV